MEYEISIYSVLPLVTVYQQELTTTIEQFSKKLKQFTNNIRV